MICIQAIELSGTLCRTFQPFNPETFLPFNSIQSDQKIKNFCFPISSRIRPIEMQRSMVELDSAGGTRRIWQVV